MDMVRHGYKAKMRLWADQPDVWTQVQWFRAAESALDCPGPHGFTSWTDVPDSDKEEYKTFTTGEPVQPFRWSNSAVPAPYLGLQYCGRPEALSTGGVTGVDVPMPVLPDGSVACCAGGIQLGRRGCYGR